MLEADVAQGIYGDIARGVSKQKCVWVTDKASGSFWDDLAAEIAEIHRRGMAIDMVPEICTPAEDVPTAWFLYATSTRIAAAARQYWPASSVVQVWNPANPVWTDRPILEDLADDPAWIWTTQSAVEAWIASEVGEPN